MAAPWVKKQDLSAFEDLDIDELLAQLTPEEIEQLESEVDPDNSLLPPSDRCRPQTSKSATGPLNRAALLKWLEDKAKAEKDWDEAKPYTKEKRGRAWTAKEPEQTAPRDAEEEQLHTDFDEILNQATEEELVDLAAVLGFHSILNQDQFNASLADKPVHGGFKGVAKATVPPPAAALAPNNTDVDASIEQLKNNDPKLTELNLNNIKNISEEKFERLFEALETNTHLIKLSAASTGMADRAAKSLAKMLLKNTTLKCVVVDSNYIKRDQILQILAAINEHKTIKEISLENQKPAMLGVKAEQSIAKLVEANDTLEKLGLDFETLNARIRVQDQLQENYDKHRTQRVKK